MIPPLITMREHIMRPRQAFASGAIVLSSLPRGRSVIGSSTVSLKMVLDGEEQYQIDGRVYRLQPGSFLYVEQGATCEANVRSNARGVCVSLPVGHSMDMPLEGENTFGRAMVLPVRNSRLGQLFRRRAQQLVSQQSSSQSLAPNAIAELQAALFDQAVDIGYSLEQLDCAKLPTRQRIYARLEQARDIIHGSEFDDLDLVTLARSVGLSQFHFSRYFKMLYGKSPIHYHRSLRLSRVAVLITGTKMSISEIALAAGYSDQVAMTRAFTKEFGIPPGRFRERGGLMPL